MEFHHLSPVRQHSLLSQSSPQIDKITLTCSGFIRQWPALPRFGVFLMVSVLPVPHVEDGDRYVVGRVDTLPGFYGVQQYIGFRDEPALHIDEIITKINEVETRLQPAIAGQIMNQLVECSRRPTHVYVSPNSFDRSCAK